MSRKTQIPKNNTHFKPKKRSSKRLAICLWLLLFTLIFVGLTIFLISMQSKLDSKKVVKDDDTSIVEGSFGIQSITVEGNQHYTSDQIIKASGLFKGKSVWKINKTQSAARIKQTCTYVESVHISTKLLNQVTIKVTETSIAGAIYNNQQWILVGKNGQGVDAIPVESDYPPRYVYYRGAIPSNEPLGKQAMDEKSTELFISINDAIAKNKIEGVSEVDITNISDIKINWKNQIIIRLGNDSNLEYEISIAKQTIPKVLEKHGKQTHGTLDISSYSNKELTNQVIFTPDN